MSAVLIAGAFERHFARPPHVVVRAPGRINLIGEHTDYNGGWALPAAIDRAIWLAVSLRDDDELFFLAHDLQQHFHGSVRALAPSALQWPNYLLGCFSELKKAGLGLRGAEVVFGGNIPIGAGLSSSAAIESGLLFSLNELYSCGFSREALATLARQAENNFVGTQCGIMDMFASLMGREGHAMQLDCRSLEHAHVPVEMNEASLLLCDTGVKHELASSEYNLRRKECETGMNLLGAGISSLRDTHMDMFEGIKHKASVPYKRCRFVLEENARVLEAASCLRAGNLSALGPLLYASHAGLRDLYEVSCPELDFLVEQALAFSGSLGARMMGGGFGGCTLHLLEKGSAAEFSAQVGPLYEQKWGRKMNSWEVALSDGATVERQY
jgi:galactokinase